MDSETLKMFNFNFKGQVARVIVMVIKKREI